METQLWTIVLSILLLTLMATGCLRWLLHRSRPTHDDPAEPIGAFTLPALRQLPPSRFEE